MAHKLLKAAHVRSDCKHSGCSRSS